MAEIDIWMPLYIGDYLKDTGDLTRAEHGTYLLTMMYYWTNQGALPDRRFRAICGKELGRVSEFYSLCDGLWHHKRIDFELEKARQRHQSAREKAIKGVKARKEKYADNHKKDDETGQAKVHPRRKASPGSVRMAGGSE